MTDLLPLPEQQAWNPELADFANFARPRKDQTPRKVQREKERPPAPQPTSIHNLSMTSMVWNIATGQLGLAALSPSSCTPAH